MEAVAYGLRSYAFGSGNAGLHAHSAFACEASAIWGLLELDGGGLASALPLVAGAPMLSVRTIALSRCISTLPSWRGSQTNGSRNAE